MTDHNAAVDLAWAYAAHHAEMTLEQLLRMLEVEKTDPAWRSHIAPFVPVWAAMVTAAADGHRTIAGAHRSNGAAPESRRVPEEE